MRLVKASRTSSVYRLSIGPEEVFYKVDNVHGVSDFLKKALPRSRSLRAWRAFEYLERRGSPVPTRVLCGERRRGPYLLESFLVTLSVAGGAPLDEYVAAASTRRERRRRLDAVITPLASLLKRIHAENVYYADLNPAKVLVVEVNGAPEKLVLLDADRTTFPERRSWRRRKKNLAQINACFDDWATLHDKLQFCRLYDPEFAELSQRERRARLAEIDATTRRPWL